MIIVIGYHNIVRNIFQGDWTYRTNPLILFQEQNPDIKLNREGWDKFEKFLIDFGFSEVENYMFAEFNK